MRKNRKYFNVNGDCKPGMHYMVRADKGNG